MSSARIVDLEERRRRATARKAALNWLRAIQESEEYPWLICVYASQIRVAVSCGKPAPRDAMRWLTSLGGMSDAVQRGWVQLLTYELQLAEFRAEQEEP